MKPVSNIAYLLQHVARVLHRQVDQVLQERLGIGMSQYKILMMLQTRPSSDQRRLANYLGQTEASISRQVKLLHEQGLLVTRIDPRERRRHITVLTDKGLHLTEAARETLAQAYTPALATLGDKEQAALEKSLAMLHDQVCAPGRPMACDHPFDTT